MTYIDRAYAILLISVPFCRFCLLCRRCRRRHLIFVCLVFVVVSAFLFVVAAVAVAFSFGCPWAFVPAVMAAIFVVAVAEADPWIFLVVPNRSATPRPASLPARIGRLPEVKPIGVQWLFHRCFQRTGRH